MLNTVLVLSRRKVDKCLIKPFSFLLSIHNFEHKIVSFYLTTNTTKHAN